MATINVQSKHAIAALRLRELAKGLLKAGRKEFFDRANAEIEKRIMRIASSKLSQHKRTGEAESIVKAYPDERGIALVMPRYLRLQGERRKVREARIAKHGKASKPERKDWWPFSRGIPTAIKQQAAKIYARELHRLLEP